jgi:hypothetical protein
MQITMNEETQNKDSYDQLLSFSRITPENWSLPDRKNYMPFGVSKVVWAGPFLKPRLNANVPLNVVQTFEIARGCIIYSWFFYPLATLGAEQCMRVGELAIWERCRLMGQESDNFFANLQTLFAAGMISSEDESRLQAMRRLRNSRSHIKNLMLLDPGMAITALNDTVELINRLFATPGKDWTAEWERSSAKFLSDVLADWRTSRNAFPKNLSPGADWPIPFFGDPARAVVATVGVNPAGTEFSSDRKWAEIKTEADWIQRLKTYFRNPIPSHRWFEPWRVGLELLRLSYEKGTATHLDISYRPTIAMVKNPKADSAEFRRMAEQDVAWFFRLLPLCPRLKGLLIFGPIVRSDGSCENLAQFLRDQAPRHGFTVLPKGIEHDATKRRFFIHEVETPGEKCITCRVVKNLYANRDELRLWLK